MRKRMRGRGRLRERENEEKNEEEIERENETEREIERENEKERLRGRMRERTRGRSRGRMRERMRGRLMERLRINRDKGRKGKIVHPDYILEEKHQKNKNKLNVSREEEENFYHKLMDKNTEYSSINYLSFHWRLYLEPDLRNQDLIHLGFQDSHHLLLVL